MSLDLTIVPISHKGAAAYGGAYIRFPVAGYRLYEALTHTPRLPLPADFRMHLVGVPGQLYADGCDFYGTPLAAVLSHDLVRAMETCGLAAPVNFLPIVAYLRAMSPFDAVVMVWH